MDNAIIKEGLRNVAAGTNAISLKRGIDKATTFLVEKIKEHAKPVEDSKAISQVASISAGKDDEVGQMIASTMDKVGKEGLVSLEEDKSKKINLVQDSGADSGASIPLRSPLADLGRRHRKRSPGYLGS